jgi:hypothetical protein
VRLPSGGELLFCGHHGRRHSPKLKEVAVDIQDEYDRLTADSSTSPAREN